MSTDPAYLAGIALAIGIFILAVYFAYRSKRVWRIVGIPSKIPRNCPKCAEKLPFFRFPRSLRQFFAGGWTCRRCHAEISKWGEVIDTKK